ncbi:MAG: hypothetical protein HYV07_15330 [Deltaproteobacteria bacterium]|nr:hypothetical protein [Deltaproteobacteria bacterium]
MWRSGPALSLSLLVVACTDIKTTDGPGPDAVSSFDATAPTDARATGADAHAPDARVIGDDAASNDAGVTDAALEDASLADAGPPCVPGPVPPTFAGSGERPPDLLSETGLFADILTKELAPEIRSFAPQYTLWSDGAVKQRWVYLPECSVIDTSDMNHWSIPVGTRLFKEFVRDGKRIETRLVTRFGPLEEDFSYATYVWTDDESEAVAVTFGLQNARGTNHDVPPLSFCDSCHGRSPEHALGFAAIQLDHANSATTLFGLAAEGRLSVPPTSHYVTPGSPEVSTGLGYLHANCGNCHNESDRAVVFLRAMSLRLSVDELEVTDTAVYRTAVNVPVEKFVHPGVTHRVLPQDVAASAIGWRITVRSVEQMPPIATELVDPAGVATVHAMIESLPP